MAKRPKYYKVHTDGCTVELEPIYEELVRVVHCKDCIYRCTDSCPAWYVEDGTYRDKWVLNNDNDFCSFGERITDG